MKDMNERRKNQPYQNWCRGFTLVEMLVVLLIITIITSVALLGQSRFNQTLILNDTAYTVAFSVRQAQTLGLSSRLSNSQGAGYGVHFSSSGTPGSQSYYVFADLSKYKTPLSSCPTGTAGTPEEKPGNCVYDFDQVPLVDQRAETYSFRRGFYVDRFCGRELPPSTTLWCSSGSTSVINRINVVFVRPSTDSVITGVQSNGTLVGLRNAAIYIKSPDGVAERPVCISQVGQVFVPLSTCTL